ncbi:conjugal transfer protein TraF [Vibrio sp. SCSIO 43137]|uniref:conjugal transfer protein TraF n=1 Tax=Vibrio sp. SCSIO 43137 TaxID=3021011 RepID=UPI002306E85D|nr:conjugal transfer protein TraF [Vibrio sp. SCSIO 43137]WCE31450.1 conjugal transfer protein TraF [Vibrio sp. SCSIO 43137]
MNFRHVLLSAVAVAVIPGYVYCATQVADSRGNGMGNTGVASADYLVAPFYNPALTAHYRDSDDVGLLLPAVGASLKDSDDTLGEVDDLQDTIDAFKASPSTANINKLNGHLDRLQGDAPLTASANAGIAVAIPNEQVALNIYTRGYVEIAGKTNIPDYVNTGNAANDTTTRYTNSEVELAAFGFTELGVSFAKQLDFQGQAISVGFTPKYQQLRTYYRKLDVENFELDDYDESERNKKTLNMDIGALWHKDEWRVGFSVKDLFKKEIKTEDPAIKYELNPQATVGAAYATQLFTAAIDVDLTKQSRFNHIDDDTQFVRFGVEGNAWDWLQVRAGYQIDTKDTMDNTVTAGIGISPFDVVSLDIAGSYADKHEFGGSANLAFTF